MPPTAVVLAGAVACSIGIAGCGASAAEVTSLELSRRVNACLGGERVGEVRVVTWVQGRRLQVVSTAGLSIDEEVCVRDLVGQQTVTGLFQHRLRVRIERARDPHPALRFMRARRAEVIACRPCSTTRIVATPAGDRYALAAELVGDDPELDPDERACIAAALAGMPPPGDDAREAVAAFGRECR